MIKDIKKNFSPEKRFMTGRQYVETARQELLNKPVFVAEPQDIIKSNPKSVHLQRTRKMITN